MSIILSNSEIKADQIFFDSKNVKIEENGNMIYASKGLARIPEEKILIDSKIYSIVLYSYLLKNKIQKMFTGLTIKQYLKQNIKRFVQ